MNGPYSERRRESDIQDRTDDRAIEQPRLIFDMIGVSMETFAHIPLAYDTEDIASRLRFDPARAGLSDLDGLIGLAKELIRLRAVYEVAYIGAKGERTVEVAGVTFESPILRRNLE